MTAFEKKLFIIESWLRKINCMGQNCWKFNDLRENINVIKGTKPEILSLQSQEV